MCTSLLCSLSWRATWVYNSFATLFDLCIAVFVVNIILLIAMLYSYYYYNPCGDYSRAASFRSAAFIYIFLYTNFM